MMRDKSKTSSSGTESPGSVNVEERADGMMGDTDAINMERADGMMRDADETIINEDMMPVTSVLNTAVILP